MDVGQVSFSIRADGLSQTMSQVKSLETTLNRMDGRTYGKGAFSKGVFSPSFMSQWGKAQHNIVDMGSQMITLGKALQGISAPFTNIMKGFARGLGFMAMTKVMNSFQGAVERYDILNTYSKILKEIGVDSSQKFVIGTGKAQTAVEHLEQSVLGLPTGLDEIVAAQQQYVTATGDVEKATKMAIAANNAYVAGRADATQKRFAQRQLRAIFSGSELTTNQWDSLQRNLPMAFKAVAKQLHYSAEDSGKLLSDLKSGKVASEEFINAFIEVGTEGGPIARAAQRMKDTWAAVSDNISNRLNAMGQKTLETLDSIFQSKEGRSFLQFVLGENGKGEYIGGGLRGIIDDISKSLQEWIKANPEKIMGFFDRIRKIDFKGMASGVGAYLSTVTEWISKLTGVFGNANFVRIMLDLGLLGKGLAILGGIMKGTAWLTGGAWALFNSGKITATMKAVAETGTIASTIPITWQGVANKALMIAAIPAIAGSLWMAARALIDFGKINVSWSTLLANLGKATLAISYFGTIAAGLGALLGGTGPFGWAGAIAEGVGLGTITAISGTLIAVAKGLNDIANAEVPDASKIEEVISAIDRVGKAFKAENPFLAIGKMFDAWSKSAEFKAIGKMDKAFTAIKNIAKLKLPKGWKDKSIKRLNDIQEVVSTFEASFAEVNKKFEDERGRNTRNGATSSTRTSSSRIEQFAHDVETINASMGSIVSIIDNANTINKKLDKAASKMPMSATKGEKHTALFSQAAEGMKQITEGLYNFLKEPGYDGKPLFQNLQEVCRAFSDIHMGNIKNQLNYIPEMIGSIIKINERLAAETRGLINTNGSPHLTSVSEKLKPIFKDIGKIAGIIPKKLGGLKKLKSINDSLGKIKTTFDKLKELSGLDANGIDMTGIETLAGKIKEALDSLEEIGEKNVKISLKAEIDGQDQVVSDVKKDIKDVINRIKKLPAKTVKNINVTVTARVVGIEAAISGAKAGIQGAMDAIRKIPSVVNKPITVNTGGHPVEQHGGHFRVYRAGGGSIRRGTDSVEALLTPGEWVVNRHAASMLGDDVLNRLNHLDIRGALDSLSVKAGQIHNKTINSTKNANVTVNNYHSDGVGYGRAGRFVRSL